MPKMPIWTVGLTKQSNQHRHVPIVRLSSWALGSCERSFRNIYFFRSSDQSIKLKKEALIEFKPCCRVKSIREILQV